MRNVLAALWAAFFLSACVTTPAGAPGDWPLEAMRDATVRVVDGRGHGSGVLIASDTVLTAKHVTPDSGASMTVEFARGEAVNGVVFWRADGTDVALLRLEPPAGYAPAALDCAPPGWGERVAIVAHPLSLRWVINFASIGMDEPGPNGWAELQAHVNPGSSGGPVFDRAGHVRGIVAAFWWADLHSGRGPVPDRIHTGISWMTPASAFCRDVVAARRDAGLTQMASLVVTEGAR